MVQLNNKNATTMGKVIAIVCFLSNFTQLPFFVDLQLSSTLSIIIWICFTAYVLLKNGTLKVVNDFFPYLMIMLTYVAFLGIGELLSDNKYLNTAIMYPFVLSMFIFCLGTNVGNRLNEKDLFNMFLAYILSALVVGLNIYFEYLFGADINDRIYAYDSKNSISQILLTGIILSLFYMVPNFTKLKRLLSFGVALFLGVTVMLLKSRATIISVPVIMLFAFIFGSETDKNFRKKIIFLVLAIVIYFLLNPQLFQTLVDAIVYGGRDSDSLDDISSGRWSEWVNFPKDLGEGWFFGNGRMKRESLILTAILEYGIPMGLVIIGVAFSPLKFAIKHLKSKNRVVVVLFYVALCYFINSVFEQLAPFGPGVKCYFVWLLFGILLSQKEKYIVKPEETLNEKNDK